MMTPQEFEAAFPKVMDWIHRTLSAHASRVRPVASATFKRLPLYFSQAQLATAKYVIVDQIPLPPLSSMGLTRFREFERGAVDGITYLDRYFLTRARAGDESLHFHEMIHIVQWRLLGAEFFVAMYASGLEKFGYRESPLEKMAYEAERQFERSDQVFDAEQFVAQRL
jgi:hypothetical protein